MYTVNIRFRLDFISFLTFKKWMSEVTREDTIRNGECLGVASTVEKTRKNRLKCFSYVTRRDKKVAVKVVMRMNLEGMRGRGRPKKIWMDEIESDMRVAGMIERVVRHRAPWK